jgi:hypothetical protein
MYDISHLYKTLPSKILYTDRKRSAVLMYRHLVARIVSDGCIHAELLTCSQKPL